jgi:hypothetical protein
MNLITAIGLGVAIAAALALIPEAIRGLAHHHRTMRRKKIN